MDSAVKYSLKEESGEDEPDVSSDCHTPIGQSSLRGHARAEGVDPMIRTIREDSDVEIDICGISVVVEDVNGIDDSPTNTPRMDETTSGGVAAEAVRPLKAGIAMSETTTVDIRVVGSGVCYSPSRA